MPFEEALERFARVDPKDITEMEIAERDALPLIEGRRITEDEEGNVCLTDLYEIAGRPENLQPAQWKRHTKAVALKAALDELIVCNTHRSAKTVSESTYYVKKRGPKSQTFAHPVLALEYAEVLDPKIGIKVKEVFLRYRANDISLANEILDRIAAQVEEDEQRIFARDETVKHNKQIAVHGKEAGCKGWQYAELHNSGYRGLYNDLDENGIHALKKLTKNQKILDHMGVAEAAANFFRVTQANLAMERLKPGTPQQAFDIARKAGEEVRDTMERVGGIMPEDMPAADSIKDAKKRLETHKPLLKKGE
jgi:hypothetical protein